MDIELVIELKTKLEENISEIVEKFEKETGFSVKIIGFRVDLVDNKLIKTFLTDIEKGNITVSSHSLIR